jgi:hypothetical protein
MYFHAKQSQEYGSVCRQNIPYVIDEYESCGKIRLIK